MNDPVGNEALIQDLVGAGYISCARAPTRTPSSRA
jgi:hypothetical protein